MQYVQNEIEMVDPFLVRDSEKVFQAPSIHRSPLQTFLEKKGSPWEQCMLLVYLLKHAGYKTKYIEGISCHSRDFAEQLLFMQFPEEQEVLLNYPGVMFFEKENWHSIFPWMKEIQTIEGHDLYSILPEKYGNAERWLKQYLCNDENILRHVGPDGNDTVAILFVRHLEEILRNQGLSIQDVGTHRSIKKRQYNNWSEFPRPHMIGEAKLSLNLPNRIEIFAKLKITIHSEQNPSKKIILNGLNLSKFSLDSFAIYFTNHGPSQQLFNFCSSENLNSPYSLLLDSTDSSINIEILYETLFGPKCGYNVKKQFSLSKGTCAALCLQSGSANDKTTSLFAEKFIKTVPEQEKLNAFFSFIGAAYFEKCSRSEQILAQLHKISPRTHFAVGFSKISPSRLSTSDLRFPQVDMCIFNFTQSHHKNPFSAYQEPHVSYNSYNILTNADFSSNEHQILREIYQDSHAISTVKLLQIANRNHQRKGLDGPGFLIFTSKNFPDTQKNLGWTSYSKNIDTGKIKKIALTQWNMLCSIFNEPENRYTYAYMTPGPVSSLDGCGLIPPSYTGIGTLFHSPLIQGAMISDGVNTMNGGYGSSLPGNFVQKITNQDLQLVSNGNSYSLFSPINAPIFNGISSHQLSSGTFNSTLPIFEIKDGSNQSLTCWKNEIWTTPITNLWKADVRPDHKSFLSTVSDPVDVVSGAYYVDELDLNLSGVFPLEIRRNYSSQNLLPGLFGHGWKLSLNPFLHEDGDKLFVAEQDGTVIAYRFNPIQNRWIVNLEDNPELNNYNKKGIGSTSNPFHAYIEKTHELNLYGADGSKRVFQNNLLKSWSDHAGNTLTFSYENENLKRIENSSGGFISFEYNYGGKISEVYTKDGRRITYSYDSQGNLSSVTLPNSANIKYEYDRFHRIIREIKPHGRILENIYRDDKVAEQRSPVGPYQQMVTSAKFTYDEGITKVTDPNGQTTEYKIYKNQIYKVVDPEGNVTLQSWFLNKNSYFDAELEDIQQWNQPGAYQRSLKSTLDKRGLITTYLYDEKGNPQEISLIGDDLTGKGSKSASKFFTYNEHNLCVQEIAFNTKTVTCYDPVYPYLVSRIEKYADETLVSFVDMEYTGQGLISKKNHSGALSIFEYDNRGFPLKITQKTGTDDPDVITSYLYNDQGQCVDHITADAIQHNDFDIMGNQYCSTISLNSGKILSKTYAGYDLNNEMIWKQGDDPLDTLYLDYNASGLIKASRKHLSEIKDSSINSAGIAYTLYEYDACGRLMEQIDPLGNSTILRHDALGRIIESTKNGLSTKFTYEPGGQVASCMTPGGATTSNLYTVNGLLKTKVDPDGSQISYLYDVFGRIIQEEKNGLKTTIFYDDAALEEKRSEGELIEIRKLDAHGNLISFTDRAGYTLNMTYDALNRIKTKTTPNGDVTTWKYLGDTTICIMPNGESIIHRYEAGKVAERQIFSSNGSLLSQTLFKVDLQQSFSEEITDNNIIKTWTNTLGLPIRIQQENKTVNYIYDALGNCISTIDEDGHTAHNEFDKSNRVIKKTLPDSSYIKYEYDDDSNLIAYHTPGNLTWKSSYDSMGRKTSEWQEFKGKPFQRWEYSYKNGQLIQAIDPENRIHNYNYDSHQRLIKESVEKYVREYTYESRGFLASLTEKGKDVSTVERTYDEIGRLVEESVFLNGHLLQNSHQKWTPSSRKLQIGEHTRDFQYQDGRLSEVSSHGFNLTYDYSSSGCLIKKVSPFSTLNIHYDDSQLPISAEVEINGKIFRESLLWNKSGKLASHHTSYQKELDDIFTYSSRGFLKSTQDADYSFDFGEAGNGMRTSSPHLKAKVNGLDEFGRISKEYLDNVLLSTIYDPSGQVILHNCNVITWDPWGRITAIKNNSYEWTASYDALGRRLQTTYIPLKNNFLYKSKGKSVVTNSFYDPEHEFLEIGVACEGKTFWKIYGPNSCDAVIDSAGDTVVLHHDMRNNLQAVISQEEIIWSSDYPSPYGPRGPPKTNNIDLVSFAMSLTWQSKQMDQTGYIWFGARYYDPACGRFLSSDPISHPACLDLYAYANGDPINNVDPDGRFSTAAYKNVPPQNINSVTYSLPVVTFNEAFEEKHAPNNRSRKYDLSDLGRPELPDGLGVGYVNGIKNEYEFARNSAIHISNLIGGYNIHAVYASSMGFLRDLEAYNRGRRNEDTGRVRLIHEVWDAHFDQNPDGYFLQFSHSRGTVDVCNALLSYSEERRKRIINVAIAPGGYIYSETCAKVTHYVVDQVDDFIPYSDSKGMERELNTIVTLTSHDNAPFHDHTILSPTYRDSIQNEGEDFLKNKSRKK